MDITRMDLDGMQIELLPSREALGGILSPNFGSQFASAPALAFNAFSLGGAAIAAPFVTQGLFQF